MSAPRAFLLLGLLAACAEAAPVNDVESAHFAAYRRWAAQHNKTADPARALIFAANAKFVESHDPAKAGFSVALNQFADLTAHEFARVAHSKPVRPSVAVASTATTTSVDAIDWRSKGKVSPVHNMASMGCSLPDVMLDVLSSALAIGCPNATGAPLVFSYPQLIECAADGVGCAGNVRQFEEYIEKHGVMTAAAYQKLPGTAGTCRVSNTSSTRLPCQVSQWVNIPPQDSDALKAAVAQQPVEVLVNAASSGFQFYKSGVFSSCESTSLDHAMMVVGFGKEDKLLGKDFWIVKNDWGSAWGNEGYIDILRESGKGPGMCGIASDAGYVKLK